MFDVNEAGRLFTNCACLRPGDTEVWYYTGAWKHDQIFPKAAEYNADDLTKTHILLARIAGTDLEQIWQTLQGEIWSPNAEANEWLRANGHCHTSMDMGDIVKLPDGTLWMCESIGFKQVKAA